MRLAVCVHDGWYGCGTGAGWQNWRFLQCCAPLVDQLYVLPVHLSEASDEFDHAWHATALELDAEVLPVDNGGGPRYGGPHQWAQASRSAAAAIARLGRVSVVSFDTAFAGLLRLLDPGTVHIHIPRSTARLHAPHDRARLRWEHDHYNHAGRHRIRLGAISKFMRTHLTSRYHLPPAAIIDVFDGPVQDEWAEPPQPCPIELSKPFVLCYGRAQPYKGQDLLVEALGHLPAPPPAVIGVVCETSPGGYARRIARRCHELFLNATVVLTYQRWLRDLIGHPRLAAVVIPSRTEPFGRIPFECYTHPSFAGVVVASDAGGLAETVIPHLTGFRFRAGSSRQLAAALIQALATPRDQRLQMIENARRLLERDYQYEHNVETLIDTLDHATG